MDTRRHLYWIAACLLLAACTQSTLLPPDTATPFLPITPTVTQTPYPTPVTPQPTGTRPGLVTVTPYAPIGLMSLYHHSGQTFIAWLERTDLNGELYRVYRANAPIRADTLKQAQRLAETGKGSSRFYANRYRDSNGFGPRLSDRLIIRDGGNPFPTDTGLLVWTLAPEDFGGNTSGIGYYAVTVTPPGGSEEFSTIYTQGPVQEAVADPLPVEISSSAGIHPGPGGHFYIQYMDLRRWNPTFHAPNETNQYYGLDPKDPNLTHALAYAYDYSIFEPTEKMCGGKVPDVLPVMVYLHGWRNNRYPTPLLYDNASCAYGVYPIDETETWYFGFARYHDYRKGGLPGKGDVIENYTEQRVLRMVYDLMRKPPGPPVDPQRVYLIGHSMGGTGALAFAERYPNVFAALYAGEPMTNFRTSGDADQDFHSDVAIKWGPEELNLPIAIAAPGGWADALQTYNGVGVWDWQNFTASLSPGGLPGHPGRAADPMAPLGVDHGDADTVIPFASQAQPFYPLLSESGQPWGGAIFSAQHEWSVYGYLPPTLAKVDKVPFWNYQVIRDETAPGFSGLSTNNRHPEGVNKYNLTILWSASWAAWDGAPVDDPDRWRMSFCSVKALSQECGTGVAQTVDITPRRLQHFQVTPGAAYTWENRRASDNQVVASGTVTADANGLLTVKGFAVSPEGNRLEIKKK